MNTLATKQLQNSLEKEIPDIASIEICDLNSWKAVERSEDLNSRWIENPENEELIATELKRLKAEGNQCIRFRTRDGRQGYVTYARLLAKDFVLVAYLPTVSERSDHSDAEEHVSMSEYYRSMNVKKK